MPRNVSHYYSDTIDCLQLAELLYTFSLQNILSDFYKYLQGFNSVGQCTLSVVTNPYHQMTDEYKSASTDLIRGNRNAVGCGIADRSLTLTPAPRNTRDAFVRWNLYSHTFTSMSNLTQMIYLSRKRLLRFYIVTDDHFVVKNYHKNMTNVLAHFCFL